VQRETLTVLLTRFVVTGGLLRHRRPFLGSACSQGSALPVHVDPEAGSCDPLPQWFSLPLDPELASARLPAVAVAQE
jgi:hypothetical protein